PEHEGQRRPCLRGVPGVAREGRSAGAQRPGFEDREARDEEAEPAGPDPVHGAQPAAGAMKPEVATGAARSAFAFAALAARSESSFDHSPDTAAAASATDTFCADGSAAARSACSFTSLSGAVTGLVHTAGFAWMSARAAVITGASCPKPSLATTVAMSPSVLMPSSGPRAPARRGAEPC